MKKLGKFISTILTRIVFPLSPMTLDYLFMKVLFPVNSYLFPNRMSMAFLVVFPLASLRWAKSSTSITSLAVVAIVGTAMFIGAIMSAHPVIASTYPDTADLLYQWGFAGLIILVSGTVISEAVKALRG